jgi:hypothetical protein
MTAAEKKGIGKAKAGLVVSSVLIAILAVSNVWSYTSLQNQINTLNNEKSNLQSQINTLQAQLSSLNTTYQNYVSTHSHSNSEYDALKTEKDALNTEYQNYMATHSYSNSEYDSLQSDYNNYIATHHHTDSEYDALKSESDALKAPKLIKVNLRADDNRPFLATPYLHVYGEICNVGTNRAYNCKLHVVAYQSGGVVAIDTYITLGSIGGESWTSVDSKIYYSGSALVSWTITPEWTS